MFRYDVKVILMPFSYLHATGSNKYEFIIRLWKSCVCIRYESGIIELCNGLSITVWILQ